MPPRSRTDMTLEGHRALRGSSHTDTEPGLEMVNWGTVLGGSALLAYGLIRRRRLTDMFMAGIGAAIAYRGLSQSDVVNRSLKRLALHTKSTTPIEVGTSMTIECPVDEVYEFWRNLENLPRFMKHLALVEAIDEERSRWVARLPTGITLEWTAEIVEDRPNELLAWQSVRGSDIYNEGFVTFEPVFDGAGTELHAHIIYHPPAGEFGARIAGFFEELQARFVREDLRSFKRLMETGELPTIEGQPSARRRSRGNGRYERISP